MIRKQFEKAADFIKSCSSKTALLYDTDADGVTGGAIVSRTLKGVVKEYPLSIPDNHFIPYITNSTRQIYEKLDKANVESIITVDMPSDQGLEYLSKLAEKASILIIDHHQPNQNLNRLGRNIVHVNSHFLGLSMNPFNYCGSKLSYDICSQALEIEDLSWLAGAGIIGDYSGEAWKDFIDGIYERHPTLKEGKSLYGGECKLGEISSLINAGQSFSGSEGAKVALEACVKVSSPEHILEGKLHPTRKLKEFRSSANEEIERLTKNWKSNAEIIDEKSLVFYLIPTDMFVQPEVANRISHEKPNYTFVLTKVSGEITYVTLRRIDEKINCGELAKISTQNLKNAGGGGHVIAAGAHIMTEDKEEFKNEVIKYIENHLK